MKAFGKSGNSSLERVSLGQYNKELNDAMDRINMGNFTTLEELEKEIQSW